VEVTLSPLTSAARGVALWLGATLVVIAGLTAAGVAEPAFRNEPPVLAASFLLGALVAAFALWRREPPTAALAWLLVNAILAGACVAFPVALGLARAG
jgi:FtsH-binding integral membrane protein